MSVSTQTHQQMPCISDIHFSTPTALSAMGRYSNDPISQEEYDEEMDNLMDQVLPASSEPPTTDDDPIDRIPSTYPPLPVIKSADNATPQPIAKFIAAPKRVTYRSQKIDRSASQLRKQFRKPKKVRRPRNQATIFHPPPSLQDMMQKGKLATWKTNRRLAWRNNEIFRALLKAWDTNDELIIELNRTKKCLSDLLAMGGAFDGEVCRRRCV